MFAVTFRKEGVDWNLLVFFAGIKYALRHLPQGRCGLKCPTDRENVSDSDVTFRKEGVDWNKICRKAMKERLASPSARKVWIEIISTTILTFLLDVTFRKEGVDWNRRNAGRSDTEICHLPQGRCGLKLYKSVLPPSLIRSPSARKVWIEIGRGE